MQAQPRGKKRGPKENIDVGGKKPKKEKDAEEPKPYVCAIYRRDIASFLTRAKIQQWRQTSSHSNASLIEFPSRLPRFKYHTLGVIFASGERCNVQKSGFLDQQSDDRSMWGWGEEFNSIYKFRFCCRDVRSALQDRASELVGQRLFPNKPDDEGVAFKLKHCVNRRPKPVLCRVPNLLTKKTATAMLHFLHHLNQACFEYIDIVPGATADAAECVFNPLMLQTFPKFRLRGVKLGRAENWRAVLSNLTVEMASEMRIRFNVLYYRSYDFDMDLPPLLDFIANGRQLEKRLELDGEFYLEDIDQTVKHFEEDVRSLEGAIRDVRYEYPYNRESDDWPARSPREAATQVTERDDGMVDYRFDYTNSHSKEPFSLLLGTRHHEGRVRISKFHLKFGST